MRSIIHTSTMSSFLRYAFMDSAPTPQEIAEKIWNCRAFLDKHVNGVPLCQTESHATVEDFSARYRSCMDCHRAVSEARGLAGHHESDLRLAFAHIDGVLDACTATLGVNGDRLPPPVRKAG